MKYRVRTTLNCEIPFEDFNTYQEAQAYMHDLVIEYHNNNINMHLCGAYDRFEGNEDDQDRFELNVRKDFLDQVKDEFYIQIL